MDGESRRTPLYPLHVELGARMIDFAGWRMPVEYTSILEEHRAVREHAGLFDLCHMGELVVRGDGAAPFLDWAVTRRVSGMAVGEVAYTPLCRPDGGVVDDILVYRRPGDFMLVVNAANTDKDARWLKELAVQWRRDKGGAPVEIEDVSDATALLAVQGPAAEAIIAPLVPPEAVALRYYRSANTTLAGRPVLLSRTGYTGEDGFEIYFDAGLAPELWTLLLEAGREHGLVPVGLGARDTLRLEARFLLYGNDLDEGVNPLEAGLNWAVDFDKPDFVGREALLRVQREGVKRRLVAFEMLERAIPRHGYPIVHVGNAGTGQETEAIGHVTSGTHSPTLGKPIGLGYVASAYAQPGNIVSIEVRGHYRQARLIKGRFVPSRVKQS